MNIPQGARSECIRLRPLDLCPNLQRFVFPKLHHIPIPPPHSPPPPIHSYHNHNHHNHRLVPCPSVQPARYRPKIFGQPATVTSPEPPSSSSSTCCLLACLLKNPNRSSLGSCLRLVSAFTPCSIHVDSVRWTVSHLPPPPKSSDNAALPVKPQHQRHGISPFAIHCT